MKITYRHHRFTVAVQDIIDQANVILGEYSKKGYDLTVRQLYYVFIGRDLLPESWIDPEYNAKKGLPPDTKNTIKNYKRLGGIINEARLAGQVDWSLIVDRTRNLRAQTHWRNASHVLEDAAKSFHVDMWKDQKYRVEVWVEKDALIGVVERACGPLDVPYFSTRGYCSQSEVWSAAQRLHRMFETGYKPVILHLTDHDPSGLDMSRDLEHRFLVFHVEPLYARLALTRKQIDQYSLPPNPAKVSDSRAKSYVAKHGNFSWELVALSPEVLVELIRTEIQACIDNQKWLARDRYRKSVRGLFKKTAAKWPKVVAFLGGAK